MDAATSEKLELLFKTKITPFIRRYLETCARCGLCIDCDNCSTFCPEVAVRLSGGRRSVDTDYCKGCGICVAECPRSAMSMEEPVS